MSRFLVTNIEWDTEQEDGGTPDARVLGLPHEATVEANDPEDLADILSDEYGFCIFGLEYEEVEAHTSGENT